MIATRAAESNKCADKMNVRFVDVTISRATPEADILRLLRELRPDWPSDRIRLEQLQGGCINAMYKCWLEPMQCAEPDDPHGEQRPPDALIVRLFSFKMPARAAAEPPADADPADHADPVDSADRPVRQAPGVDFEKHFFNRLYECEVMVLAAEHGLCTAVHGRFANGLCYGFAQGRTPDARLMASPAFVEQMTAKLARLHALPAPAPPSSPFATMDAKLRGTLDAFMEGALPEVQALVRDSPLPKYRGFPALATLAGETRELYKRMQTELGLGEIGFCHNDLNVGNVLWDDRRQRLWLIDFEMCMNNYVCRDLSMHLLSFCGHVLADFRPELLPDAAFRLGWLRRYVRESDRLHGRQPTAEQFEQDVWQLHRRCAVNIAILFLKLTQMCPFFEFKPAMFNTCELSRRLAERPSMFAALGLRLAAAFEGFKPEVLALLDQPTPAAAASTEV